MIKRKGKYFVIALAILMLLPNSVHAAKAWVSENGTEDKSITYDNGKNYQDYHITVQTDTTTNEQGKQVEAYCVDFNATMNGGMDPLSVTCEEISSPALAYVLNSNASHAVKQLASRTIVQQLGLNRTNHYVVSGGETMNAVNQLITQANAYAGVKGITNGSLNVPVITDGSENRVTYHFASNSGRLDNLNFECQNCKIISQSWNGTAGDVTIEANAPSCSFQIIATYTPTAVTPPSSGEYDSSITNAAANSTVMYCHGEGNSQGVVYSIDGTVKFPGGGSGSTQTGTTPIPGSGGTTIVGTQQRQVFSGEITKERGGNYYKNYCDGDNKLCTCTQQTMISAPAYCDTPGEETITIKVTDKATQTEETDVKCCILNGYDEAGNSYQMVTQEISADNPYCAVFCKEEYEMTMPGARFGDSGRYFQLDDTTVTAKRTCYATNKDQNSEAPQIKIDDFVNEVSTLQEKMIKAFNNYNRWANELKSANDLVVDKENHNGTCVDGESADNKQQIGSEQYYKEFTIKHADDWDVTGRWVIESETTKKAKYKYEENKYCDPIAGIIDNGPSAGTNGTEYPWKCNEDKTECYHDDKADPVVCDTECIQRNIDQYKNELQEYQDRYQKITKWINECYNWSNTLCLDPVVQFDYDEMYQINYTRKDGGQKTFTSKDAKLSTNKDLLKDNNTYKINESSGDLKDVNYLFCDDSSCSNDKTQSLVENLITTNRIYYRSIEVEGSAVYGNTSEFSTQIPHGTIEASDKGKYQQNYYYLGAVFPIALKTEKGVYNWTLTFSNLGQYNTEDNCALGRLDAVATATNQAVAAAAGYVCVYVVDCPDCGYECSCGNNKDCYEEYVNGHKVCKFVDPEPKCKDCDVYCVNCLFDGKDTYFYRQVSVNDFNPSERVLGTNWDATEKGKATQEEIEKNGETIYENAEYSYTLTPANMQKIRKYNQQTGTYVAEDLVYDTTTDKVAGKSKFLNEGAKDGYFTENARNTKWELWQGETTDNVGPAWK